MADDDFVCFCIVAVPLTLATLALFIAFMVTKFSSCNYLVTATVQEFVKPSNILLWDPHKCKVALQWYDERHEKDFKDTTILPSVNGCSGVIEYIQEQVALLLPPEEQPPPPGPGGIPLIHVRGCVNYFHPKAFNRMDGLGDDGEGYAPPDVTSLRVVWRLGVACLCLAAALALLCFLPRLVRACHKGADAWRASKERSTFKQVPMTPTAPEPKPAETEMKKAGPS